MRLRIDLAYDGTDFRGWATQPGLRTVQHQVENALAVALRIGVRDDDPPGSARVPVVCAGRTDAGVHARGQVVHADVDEARVLASAGRSPAPPLEALVRRLNGILPPDVVVRRVGDTDPPALTIFSGPGGCWLVEAAAAPRLAEPLDVETARARLSATLAGVRAELEVLRG